MNRHINNRKFITFFALTYLSIVGFTQTDTSIKIIDTISFNNEKVYVFNNKTWEFSNVIEKINYLKTTADTSAVFKENWSKLIFPYPYNENIPDSVYISFNNEYDTFNIPYKNVLTSGFGYRTSGFHKGIDIRLAKGTKVKAAFNGKVRYARFNTGGYGNLVIIRHFNGLETYYAHLSKILVEEDEIIQSGKVIGLGGKTGVEWSGTHLHFEFRYRDLAFDPFKIISLEKGCLLKDDVMLLKSDFHPSLQNQRKYHRIKSGETLSHLARKYGTSTSRILKLNKNLSVNSILKIDQQIRVR